MKSVVKTVFVLTLVQRAAADVSAKIQCPGKPRIGCSVEGPVSNVNALLNALNQHCEIGCSVSLTGTLSVPVKCLDDAAFTLGLDYEMPRGLVPANSTLSATLTKECSATVKSSTLETSAEVLDVDAGCHFSRGETIAGTVIREEPNTLKIVVSEFKGSLRVPITDPSYCGGQVESIWEFPVHRKYDIGNGNFNVRLPELDEHTYLPGVNDPQSTETLGDASLYNQASICPRGSYIDGVSTAVNWDENRNSVPKYYRFHCSEFVNGFLPNLEVTKNNPYKYADVGPVDMCDGDVEGGDYIRAFQVVRYESTSKMAGVLFVCASGKRLGERDAMHTGSVINLYPWRVPGNNRLVGFATSIHQDYGLEGFVAVVGEPGEKEC